MVAAVVGLTSHDALRSQLGLLASSTPFVTGRPVTLFHNQKVYETGAVGFAMKGELESRSRIEFRSVVPISGPMTVTRFVMLWNCQTLLTCPIYNRAEGNMINEVDNSNPTQLLLSAIRKRGLDPETSITFKDEQHFSLGVISNGQVRVFTLNLNVPCAYLPNSRFVKCTISQQGILPGAVYLWNRRKAPRAARLSR